MNNFRYNGYVFDAIKTNSGLRFRLEVSGAVYIRMFRAEIYSLIDELEAAFIERTAKRDRQPRNTVTIDDIQNPELAATYRRANEQLRRVRELEARDAASVLIEPPPDQGTLYNVIRVDDTPPGGAAPDQSDAF